MAIISKINITEELKKLYSDDVTNLSVSDNSAGKAGDTEKISDLKSKVSQKIKLLEEQLNKPNNLPYNSPPSPSPSADSAELQSKLEALRKVEKLCEFYENSNKPSNDPKNLLDNLCDGLETFLGYNPSSKGYDGTGIVYSDLDRLCDAVMGFLSGVLSNIKDHLGQHNETITPVIKLLDTNKHLGKNGFNDAIGKVVEGVRGYNEGVEQSNNDVKNPIDELLKFTKHDGKLIRDLKSVQVDNIQENKEVEHVEKMYSAVNESLEECRQQADTFIQSLDRQTENINNLNPKLRDIVNSVLPCIKHERERLTKLAEKEKSNLQSMEAEIKTKLHDVKCKVNEHIKKKVKDLVERLKDRVREMQTKLVDINVDLTKHVQKLQKWMKDVKKFIDEHPRVNAQKILEEIKWDETNSKSAKRNEIENAARELRKKARELFEAGEAAKQKVQETVRSALQQVKSMNDALKMDLKTVKDRIKEAVMALGKKLEGDVKKDLGALKEKITEPLGKIVGSAETFSKQFTATKEAIDQAIQAVHGDIGKLKDLEKLEEIEPSLKGKTELLMSIGNGNSFKFLTTYLEQLDTDVMQKVKDAMKNIGTVIGAMYSHSTIDFKPVDVESIRPPKISTVTIGGDLVKGIRDLELSEHTKAIEEVLRQASSIRMLSRDTLEKLLTALGAIAEAVSKHSSEIAVAVMDAMRGKVKEEIREASGAIHTKVEHIKTGIQKSTDVNGDETYGLSEAQKDSRGLQALVTQFKEQINQKLEELKNNTIPQTIFKTNGGGDNYQLGDDLMSNFHGTYNNNFSTGDIKTDSGAGGKNVLDTEIGGDGMVGGVRDNKISELSKTNFTNYEKQVKQDTVATIVDDNPTQLDGQLPSKIKDIQKQVATVALASIDQLNTEAGQQLELVTKTLDALCRDIKRAAEDVQINLNALQSTKIDIDLKRIHALIDDLRKKQLGAVIGLTNNFLTQFADKAGEQIIKRLEQDANIEVTNAETDIIHELRKRYVAFIKLLLTEFSTKCKNDLYGLPDEITKDSDKGAKGFMKQLAAYFEMHLQSLELTNLASFSRPATPFTGDLLEKVASSDDIGAKHNALSQIGKAVRTMLNKITKYNHKFLSNLSSLSSLLDSIRPASYADESNPLLECIRKGVQGMCDELDKAYVSVYDGHEDYIDFNKLFDPPINVSMNGNQKHELTDAGRNLSKVCLTIFTILQNALKNFTVYCNQNWRLQKINKSTELGSFLAGQGFTVSDKDEQNGELRNHTGMQGHKIYKLLVGNDHQHIYNSDEAHEYPLAKLNACLTDYYHVCHTSTFTAKTRPCNVFEMLCWLCGFPCNSSYSTLVDAALTDLFEGPAKQIGDDEEITATFVGDVKLEAFPQSIKYDDARRAVAHICSISYDVLTTIVGTGDAQTMYAVDFCTNSLSFHYPSDPSGCFDALIDILRRLFPVFQFLRVQCNLSTKHGGWRECQYGKDIFTTISQCNEHSTHEVKCRPTSPLMSYLHDSLPGWLPHSPTAIGCKYQCNACLKSTPGMPCLTPLGFRGFSGSTKTGRNICDIFDRFFTNSYLGALLCLVPKPPSTLPEHFGFTLSLMKAIGISTAQKTRADVITLENVLFKSIAEQSINLYTEHSKLTQALTNAYGSPHPKHGECKYAHLRNLTAADSCKGKTKTELECGPYLSTLCYQSYRYLAMKHCNVYLSWAIYLPWDFWSYLKSLYDAFCNIHCQDWGCRGCLRADKCKTGSHGSTNETTNMSNCQCHSIVQCKGVSPTLYQCGFSFQNPSSLNHDDYPNKCSDFCTQLGYVLKSKYFKNLFKECDNFLFKIREPFFWTTVALWSLSLFYLLCVMIGRLDVLHIRSHLRIPSSHRITAQSLLAAAQVGRLAKISYLQP